MIILPSSAGIFRPFTGATAWTPSSLPLLAWYKADAGVLDASDNPITADSTAVKTWQDQSGNARHLVQNTSASRPVFRTVANSFSSLPALEASGSQFFENTALSLGSDVSVYVVCKFVGTPTAFTGVFQLGGNHAHLIFNDNTQHFRIQGGSPTTDVISGAAATNTRQVLKMDLATTVFRFKQSADGIDSATNTTTISLGTGYKLFQNYIGTATCQISEFILCSRVLTSGEEASLNNYLKTRYAVDTNAIYFTLPTSGAALWLDGSRLDTLYTTDTGSTNVSTNGGAIGRWEDLSGNARHATQPTAGSRSTWSKPTNGRIGLGAVAFNGSQWASFADYSPLNFGTNDFTIEGWVKPSSYTGNSVLLGCGINGIVVYFTAAGAFGVSHYGVAGLLTSSVISTSSWTHFAISRSGTNLRVFINGTLTTTLSGNTSNFTGTNAARICQDPHPGNGNYGYSGRIQNLIIYNNQALYTSNFTPFMS